LGRDAIEPSRHDLAQQVAPHRANIRQCRVSNHATRPNLDCFRSNAAVLAHGSLLMKIKSTAAPQASLAATVAGDDLAVGDYIAILSETREYLSILWDDLAGNGLSPQETVRVSFTPTSAGDPLKIEAICLPFIFVKASSGEHRSLDIRMQRLARLDAEYAKYVLKKSKKKTGLPA
jgi:hypothetical protein